MKEFGAAKTIPDIKIKIDSIFLSHWRVYYLLEDSTYAVSFRVMLSIEQLHLIKIVNVIFKKVTVLCLGAPVKAPCFFEPECSYPPGINLWCTN
jgi:hypothetical protein